MNYKWNQLHSRNSLLYASILVTTRMEVCCFIIWNSWYFRLWQSETSHSSIHTTYSVKENYTFQKVAWIINWIKSWIQKLYWLQERKFYELDCMIPYSITFPFFYCLLFLIFWFKVWSISISRSSSVFPQLGSFKVKERVSIFSRIYSTLSSSVVRRIA